MVVNRWANWEFHMSFDVRAGLVISLASIFDMDVNKYRQVLYKGHLSEMFIPYMVPVSDDWYSITYLDYGDFSCGQSAVSLEPYNDCPANDAFMDGVFESQDGTDVSLVVRMVTTVGNYDHIVDYEFKPSGSIKMGFHMPFDVRAGLIISLASIFDMDVNKYWQVLYKGHLSEMFVPYMVPVSDDWYSITYLDCGDFGCGQSTVSLEPYNNCPANDAFMDGVFASQDGTPTKISNVMCIFETEIPGLNITEARPDVSLVVRMVTTLGNYDHIVDYEFKPSGSIKVG
ncbi:hypothetical protein DY000_02053450 [Brassica cretica]|uniref:Amine oxidase n=1 Tax=Brassica cretica TaxID=69181 RepID=A0ABQ7AIV2_BRACR|nr:hypothetical protein DY000_02053450 [Brassica cretica]